MKKHVMRKYIVLAILFLFITLLCIYYLMGGIIPGINNLEVFEQGEKERYVVGVYYEGKPNSKELSDILVKYRNWILDDENPSQLPVRKQFHFLSVIDYPTPNDDTLKQFIGVAIRGNNAVLENGEEKIVKFSCQKRYTVFLKMNPWVRPPTHKVQKMILKKAKQNGDVIAFFFEIYYSDNSMQVEGFVSQ